MVSVGGIPVPLGLVVDFLIVLSVLVLYFIFHELILERLWKLFAGRVENDIEISETSFDSSVFSGYRPSVLHTSGLFKFKNLSRFNLRITEVRAEVEWAETQVSYVSWESDGFQSSLVDVENPKKKGNGWIRVNSDIYPDLTYFDTPQYIRITGVAEFEGEHWLTRGRISAQKQLNLREQVGGKVWDDYVSEVFDSDS